MLRISEVTCFDVSEKKYVLVNHRLNMPVSQCYLSPKEQQRQYRCRKINWLVFDFAGVQKWLKCFVYHSML